MTENDVKKIFSENFKRLRTERGLDQKEVAEAIGVSSSIVSDWEKGNKMPRAGTLQKISTFFEVPQHELLIEKGVQYSTYKEMLQVPIVGKVSCGNGSYAFEEVEGYESVPREWVTGGEYFFLRASGDSMIGARIQDGDLVLIRKQDSVKSGEIAAVLIDGDDAVLKRVHKHKNMMVLQSENPNYQPVFCPPAEVRILGKLIMNVIKFS